MGKEMYIQIKEIQLPPTKINARKLTMRCIKVKLSNIEDKGRIWKLSTEK